MAVAKYERAVRAWKTFFLRSENEIESKSIEHGFVSLASLYPLDGILVVRAWATFASSKGLFSIPPWHLRLFEHMLHLHLLTDADVISYVLSSFRQTLSTKQDEYLIKNGSAKGEWRPTAEAAMLERIAYQMVNFRSSTVQLGDRVPDLRTCKPLIGLLTSFTQYCEERTHLEGVSILLGPTLEIATELGKFTAAYINDLTLVGLLMSSEEGLPPALKNSLSNQLKAFITLINPSIPTVADSLSILQRQCGLDEAQNGETLNEGIDDDLGAITFQENVIDSPLVTTRSALFVYLNAMLCGRPIADDEALFAFLNARYTDNVTSMITDLITATFDVLANAMNRTEPTSSINVYRSFLSNKLPSLLDTLSRMLYPPLTVEGCIADAIRHQQDPHHNAAGGATDPFGHQNFDLLSSSGMLSEARQEFLFACALYHLIPESSIEGILGDVPMQSLPESGKYNKAGLVAQCSANPNRIEDLVVELERMEGNSAEIVAAIVEIIQTLCAAKDTMTLKGVCNALSRRTQALDVILLFTKPHVILQPLCDLLDHWQDQTDQSESHTVYHEFGSILLLVLVFRHNYNFQDYEMGIMEDSFSTEDTDTPPLASLLRTYFRSSCTSRKLNNMSDTDRQRLNGWIRGLFETESIDELMSTCSPMQFHLLVATIFDQSLKAAQSGLLSLDAIKGGFEFLLGPFLLPSLVAGLGWAARRLWETKPLAPQLDTLLPVLLALIRPPAPLSPDAVVLHESVLNITAKPLERALAHVQRVLPRRRDVDPLLSALAPYINQQQQQRRCVVLIGELEGWCGISSGGILATVKHNFNSLAVWSNIAANNVASGGGLGGTGAMAQSETPPHYTHRQILVACNILGAPTVLNALLDEALRQITKSIATPAPASDLSASHIGPEILLDVLTALVCAPSSAIAHSATSSQSPLSSLRGALHSATVDAYSVSKTDLLRAELIVKLSRRVDAQILSQSAGQQQDEHAAAVAAAEVADQTMVDVAATVPMAEDLMMEMQDVSTAAQTKVESGKVHQAMTGNGADSGGLTDVDLDSMLPGVDDDLLNSGIFDM